MRTPGYEIIFLIRPQYVQYMYTHTVIYVHPAIYTGMLIAYNTTTCTVHVYCTCILHMYMYTVHV